MIRRQGLICLLLVFLMVVTLAACGKGKDTSETSNAGQASGQEQTTDNNGGKAENSSTGNETAGGQAAQAAKLSGNFNLIDLDDRDASILRGVTIKGNCAGSAEGFNSKESSLTDVRCVFELNEWVEFYPDTDKDYALRVWILKHRDDQEYYNNCKFSDLIPNFANYCDLHYPADEDNPDEWYWGDFYLNEEECEPGYYDFVFTYEGKAIAVLLTRFYKVGELTAKSDAELEALMHE